MYIIVMKEKNLTMKFTFPIFLAVALFLGTLLGSFYYTVARFAPDVFFWCCFLFLAFFFLSKQYRKVLEEIKLEKFRVINILDVFQSFPLFILGVVFLGLSLPLIVNEKTSLLFLGVLCLDLLFMILYLLGSFRKRVRKYYGSHH